MLFNFSKLAFKAYSMLNNDKEIIFVWSWKIPIPPNWYGAVEDIIWNMKTLLEKDNFLVTIINTKNIFHLMKNILALDGKLIHVHYEPYLILIYLVNLLFKKNNNIIWTSHNWYAIFWKESILYKFLASIISKFNKSRNIAK